jgi:RNA polymerase sigma-70 factor (ECF subfamily)
MGGQQRSMEESMTRRESEEGWAELMRAAINGDAGAYRQFLASLAPYLRAIARRNCARVGLDSDEAEDIVQETLLAIHLKRQTWDVDRPVGPWITAIARYKLIDRLRHRGGWKELPIDDVADLLTVEGTEKTLEWRDVDRMLGRLDDRQRDLLRLVSIEGYSVQETAKRLNMSKGAVRVAMHRAIKRLAALYRRGSQ